MADFEVEINQGKLREAVQDAEGLPTALGDAVSQIAGRANAIGSGYRTGIWHDHASGEKRGGTQPVYEGDVQRRGRSQVGIVHPGNYAAMKDNHLHNTLLKSI